MLWRSPPLDKLTCSTREYSCLPQLPRLPLQPNFICCQKSLKHFSARGIHQAERLAHKYYPTWPVTHSPFHRVMMGSIWVQLQIFFYFLWREKKASAWEHFYIYRKIQKSSSYVKLVPETCQEQPESWLSDGILMPCSWGSCIIFSRE